MTLDISLRIRFLIGEEIVPLASEVVVGATASQDGAKNGFVFRLDLQPNDPPVELNLGALIEFIENKLGAGSGALQGSSGIDTLDKIFPSVNKGGFDSKNQTVILLRAFEINSIQKLFRINVDVTSTDPSQGFLPLPSALASWLSIENLSIAFSATGTSGQG